MGVLLPGPLETLINHIPFLPLHYLTEPRPRHRGADHCPAARHHNDATKPAKPTPPVAARPFAAAASQPQPAQPLPSLTESPEPARSKPRRPSPPWCLPIPRLPQPTSHAQSPQLPASPAAPAEPTPLPQPAQPQTEPSSRPSGRTLLEPRVLLQRRLLQRPEVH